MKVLGLNIFHGDASACLIEDNKILIGVEEERLNRIKHASGFPINAIKLPLCIFTSRLLNIIFFPKLTEASLVEKIKSLTIIKIYYL